MDDVALRNITCVCVFVRLERNCSGDILISVDLGLLFEIPAGDHYVTWIDFFFSLGRNFLWPQIETTSSRILSKLGEKNFCETMYCI